MLRIRLQRTGRENIPTYRIVVAKSSDPVKGKFLEVLGFYLPAREPPVLEQKTDRVKHWVSQGAIPSETVARILKKAGVDGMEKFIHKYTKRKSKKEAPAEAAAPAPVAAAAPAPAAASESGDTAPKAA